LRFRHSSMIRERPRHGTPLEPLNTEDIATL
jgi:hypothetical protein